MVTTLSFLANVLKIVRGTSLVVQWLGLHAPNAGGLGLILGLGRSLGVATGNPLQYSCLENSMDRGAWRSTEVARVRHE